MAKSWNLKLGDKEYTIGQTRNCWIVNGVKYPQKECLTFKKYFIFSEYKLPIPDAEVHMVTGKAGWVLVVDGKYLDSGKLYRRVESIPAWAWVFVVLSLSPMAAGGAIGGACGGAGAWMTIVACGNPENSTKKKIASSTAILVCTWAVVLVLAGIIEVLFR